MLALQVFVREISFRSLQVIYISEPFDMLWKSADLKSVNNGFDNSNRRTGGDFISFNTPCILEGGLWG